MTDSTKATVETLTAEVKSLIVGPDVLGGERAKDLERDLHRLWQHGHVRQQWRGEDNGQLPADGRMTRTRRYQLVAGKHNPALGQARAKARLSGDRQRAAAQMLRRQDRQRLGQGRGYAQQLPKRARPPVPEDPAELGEGQAVTDATEVANG